MKSQIITELKKIIKDLRNRDVELSEETRLEEDLSLDSLDKIEIWLAIEETFKIDIPEEEAKMIKTVNDLIHLVEKYKEKTDASSVK